MNAKISITLPMEKIHIKVANLMEEISQEFDSISSDTKNISFDILEENDFLKQLEKIDATRKKLLLLDANLQDCYSIVNGLISYKTNEREKQNADNPTE